MRALRRCWRDPLLQVLPFLPSKVPFSILGRPSQAGVWPFWPALAHVRAGQCGAQTAPPTPKAVCVPPLPQDRDLVGAGV